MQEVEEMKSSWSVSPSQVKPQGRQVMVRRLDKEEMSRGGIVLPKSRNERNIWGELIAIGPGQTVVTSCKQCPERKEVHIPAVRNAKVGDIVAIRQWEGVEINLIDSKNYLLMDGRCVEGVRKIKG